MRQTGTAQSDRQTAFAGGPLQRGDVVAARYRVEGKLGHGGHGIVYAARHVQTDQAVALKVMWDDADPHSLRRFAREAKLVGALHHPNTVRLLDFGVTEHGEPFFAMERLHGQTLDQRLRELTEAGQVMPREEATAIAVQILRALQEAHAVGLIHRDLKPANVMLCDTMDGELHVKLFDFGIACTTDPEFAQSGAGLGTPAFMSPEQCDALPVDARSDLYAVGVILFRCLTGELPFSDPDPLALLRMHVLRPTPDVQTRSPQPIPEALANLVTRALAKLPQQRFSSAREMCDGLLGRSEPAPPVLHAVTPSEDSPETRTWRRPAVARRMPIGIAAVMLAGAVTAGVWLSSHHTHEPAPRATATPPTTPAAAGPLSERPPGSLPPQPRAEVLREPRVPPAIAQPAPLAPLRPPSRSRPPVRTRRNETATAVARPQTSGQAPREELPPPGAISPRQVERMTVD